MVELTGWRAESPDGRQPTRPVAHFAHDAPAHEIGVFELLLDAHRLFEHLGITAGFDALFPFELGDALSGPHRMRAIR